MDFVKYKTREKYIWISHWLMNIQKNNNKLQRVVILPHAS